MESEKEREEEVQLYSILERWMEYGRRKREKEREVRPVRVEEEKEGRDLTFFIRRMERRMSNLVLCSRERENGRKDELNGVGLGGGKGRERVRGKGKGKRSTCSHGF